VSGAGPRPVILYVPLDGKQPTCELERRISTTSQKVLIEQLQALKQHALVNRQLSADGTRKMEYQLTPLGESLSPILCPDGIGSASRQGAKRVLKLVPCDAVVLSRADWQSLSHLRRSRCGRVARRSLVSFASWCPVMHQVLAL